MRLGVGSYGFIQVQGVEEGMYGRLAKTVLTDGTSALLGLVLGAQNELFPSVA
jgi:hypothetical protein